ncbi:hypothetical protein N9L68_02235 [bacterium]|nr:hypothetical protein [bacterium]
MLDATVDIIIRPMDVSVQYWMHCVFVDGVLNLVALEMLEHARKQVGDVYALVRMVRLPFQGIGECVDHKVSVN